MQYCWSRSQMILLIFCCVILVNALVAEAAVATKKGRKHSIDGDQGNWESWSPLEKCPFLGSQKGCSCFCRFRQCQPQKFCSGNRMEVSGCTCSTITQSLTPGTVKDRKCKGRSKPSGCIRPPLPLNMILHPSVQKKSVIYRKGEKLKFSCKETYILDQDTVLTCMANGAWSGRLPTCFEPSQAGGGHCTVPPLPPKMFAEAGIHSQGSYRDGDLLKLRCDLGYALSNSGILRCSANGTWSGQMPACLKTGWPLTAVRVSPADTKVNISVPCKSSNATLARNEIWFCHKDVVFPHKYYVKNQHTNEVQLSLPKFGEGDEGFYTCFCEFRNGTLVSHTTLVQASLGQTDDFQFAIKPEDQSLVRGGTYILQCSAPNAFVTWLKDGHVIYYEDSSFRILPDYSLMIFEAEVWQDGTYTCVAEHIVRKVQIAHFFKVTVKDPVGEKCGLPKRVSSQQAGRIVGGASSNKGAHPWIALILIQGKNKESFMCGGSLVSEDTVLTAAHCLQNTSISGIRIKLGKYHRDQNDTEETEYGVARVAIPSTYYKLQNFHDDIAVVTLDRKVQFTDYILPICLPYRGFLDGAGGASRTIGTVAGWGRLGSNRNSGYADHLMEVTLPIQDFVTCNRSQPNLVTDSMFCAGESQGGKDACFGDSGGPFEVVRDGRTYLAGIVSWGENESCAKPDKYGFYTKVEKFVSQKNSLMKFAFL